MRISAGRRLRIGAVAAFGQPLAGHVARGTIVSRARGEARRLALPTLIGGDEGVVGKIREDIRGIEFEDDLRSIAERAAMSPKPIGIWPEEDEAVDELVPIFAAQTILQHPSESRWVA